MARRVFMKTCCKIRFLARQADLWDVYSLKLFAGAFIQPHFDCYLFLV